MSALFFRRFAFFVLAFAHRLQALFLTLGSFGGEAVLATLM